MFHSNRQRIVLTPIAMFLRVLHCLSCLEWFYRSTRSQKRKGQHRAAPGVTTSQPVRFSTDTRGCALTSGFALGLQHSNGGHFEVMVNCSTLIHQAIMQHVHKRSQRLWSDIRPVSPHTVERRLLKLYMTPCRLV